MKKLKRIYKLSVAAMFSFGAVGAFGLAGAAGSRNIWLLIVGIVAGVISFLSATLADEAADYIDTLRDARDLSFRGW